MVEMGKVRVDEMIVDRVNVPVADSPRLAGDLAVWLIIHAELLAFGILFLSYAFARTFDVALFNASQRTLDLTSGAINTALLITGSWCVVHAVQAVKHNALTVGAHWLRVAGCWWPWPVAVFLWSTS
jgi:heme/copper-type cytochrome/quinol oxidase subunit 3